MSAHRGTDVVSAEDRELARENERLPREVRILKDERAILKTDSDHTFHIASNLLERDFTATVPAAGLHIP